MADQLQALHDRPVDTVDRGWRRIFNALGRDPAGAGLTSSHGDASIMLFDAYTLADDLTFELDNPDAILPCFAKARENARQIRNIISHEMWSCLNVAYLEMRDVRLLDVWADRPQTFFHNASTVVTTFGGIAEATMYQDHGWHFFRLGRFVERALRTAALVDAQIAIFPADENHWVFDWGSLLKICEARAAFRRLNSIKYPPDDVVDFLVADARLSNSISYALREIADAHAAIAGHRDVGSARAVMSGAGRQIGRARALIDYDWPVHDRRDGRCQPGHAGRDLGRLSPVQQRRREHLFLLSDQR